MKQFYLLLGLVLSIVLGCPIHSLGQCAVRPAGSGRYTAIDAGLLTSCRSSFTDTRNTQTGNCFGNFFDSPQGGQPSDELFYKFTLETKQKVTISHCGSGFDTFVSLLDASGNVLAAANDTSKAATGCGSNNTQEAFLRRSLPAGTYYVVSEGYGTNSGNITTQISVVPTPRRGATLSTAIDAGTLSNCGALFSDLQRNDATSCFGNDYDVALNPAQQEGRPTDDIFYKFTLTSSTEVTLAHCNTGQRFVDGRDPDTYIHLLDASGNRLASNDDYGPACYSGRASLRLTLPAGTYYVVSELYNPDSGCNLITTISTTAAPVVGVAAPATTLAAGAATTLTASGATAYTWSPATGLSATTGSSVTAAPTRTTTYTVMGTGTGNCNPASASITIVVSSVPVAPNNPAPDRDRNWTFTRTYDLDGNITGEAKQFVDALGRPTQSQTKNMAAKQVFASQVVTNTGGKGVLSTLPAPIFNQEFRYRTDFMRNTGGQEYSATDFEGANASNPGRLDSLTQGTLGYYYSQLNTWEPAIAATRNPFSLTEPTPGPLGGMRRAAGAGDKFRMGAGHESKGRDFPLLNELDHYSSLRPQFVPGSATTSLRTQGVKVVSVNPNGVESIAFANREGQALASCLSGDQYPATTLTGTLNIDPTNAAGNPIYQDIHIGASTALTPVTVTSQGGGTSSFVVIDLLQNPATETTYTGAQTLNLASGFYRLQVTEGQVNFSYPVRYGNFSYTYYDDAGRAVATIAPNGLASGTTTAPTFVTRNSYDTAGRLLQTTNSDEGKTQYVYARDGRIRFSQSARQLAEGKFSYSNYDLAGRVVESGEYQTATDRSKGVVFESPLSISSRVYEAERDAQLANVQVGNGVVEYITTQGNSTATASSLTFSMLAPNGGVYALDLRYSAGLGNSTRTLSVYLNGNFYQQASFAGTSGWNNWATQTIGLSLQTGSNTVELRYGPNDNGWINLDYAQLQFNASSTANSVLNETILEDRTRTGGLEVARCSQRNQVWYDLGFQDAALNGRKQDFVLGAVAKTSKDGATTWYSYNDLGQLTWMVQEQPVVGVKTLDYTYDAAGNVLTVAYQKNQGDAFYHHYTYDANQRLTQAYTSPDGTTKTLQAAYYYYLHGPLKRVELAGNLQGLDYTYTVQGWLKTLNDSQRSRDPGKDGPNASGMFKDLFGMRMEYFDNDYRSQQQAAINPTVSLNQTRQRYDGTVRATSWRTEANAQAYGMGYLYDTKGQLLEADFATVAAGSTFAFSPTRANGEDNLSYDSNGNLGSLRRTSATGAATDNFTYQYLPGTNKLTAINNPAGTAVLDYDYDATGQMTRQRDEQGQRYLRYDVTGKVTGVFRDQARTQPMATFTYDDRGFRASKATYNAAGQLLRTTFSVRDQQGNEVSTYVQEGFDVVQRNEVPVYGASRLGTLTRLDDGSVDPRYELNDHLGNARVVFHKPKTAKYLATMEQSNATQEEQDFTNVASTRFVSNYGHNNSATVARLGMTNGLAKGPSKTLTVQRGDTVTFTAYAWLTQALAVVQNPPANTQARQSARLLGLVPILGLPTTPTQTGEQNPRPTNNQPFARLGLSAAITLGAGRVTQPATPQATNTAGNARLHYIVRDTNGTIVQEDYQYTNPKSPGYWHQLQIGLRLAQSGTVELSVETDGAASPDVFFDDIQVEQTGGMIVQEQHTYGYGAPLTGLNYVIGTKKYRHGYQGQYAEKDEETGWDDFELRMYDSRIGRWTAPDPMGQFHSPYVGMGNNPVSGVDPDGGLVGIFASAAKFLSNIGLGQVIAGAEGSVSYLAPTLGQIGSFSLRMGIGAAQAAVRYRLDYNGTSITLWKLSEGAWGKEGTYSAASGAEGFQNSRLSGRANEGPVPSLPSGYSINIGPEITTAEQNANGTLRPSYLDGGTDGIQRIPGTDSPNAKIGPWGRFRVRLQPNNLKEGVSGRDNASYYLHDSEKGASHGCIECDKGLFVKLLELRLQGVHKIQVNILYKDNDNPVQYQTNGRMNLLPPKVKSR